MVFTFSREQEITSEVLADFIAQHQALVPGYIEDKNFYEGKHAIFEREDREQYKPDNRLMVNFAKLIVDTFNGYFIGIPPRLSHDNEQVDAAIHNFMNRSNIEDDQAELSKMTSVYGHAFEYMYQDEDASTRIVENSPIDMFIVYDDTIAQEPLFAVRYFLDEDDLKGELMTDASIYQLSGALDEPVIGDEQRHFYGGVPVIEYIENEERQPIFENVKSLINALNEAVSAKADDVEYFADAYMKVLGADLDDDAKKDLRLYRLINLSGEGSDKVVIDFLQKPNADETQENLIDRLIDLIFQVAMVANINDESFGQTASGVALEFKLQPMKNLAIMKERKFRRAMQERFKLFFALPTNIPPSMRDEWMNISYQFSRNIPRNLSDEADTASKLEGIVSKETQLNVLSVVDDAKKEIARIEEENRIEPVYDFEMSE